MLFANHMGLLGKQLGIFSIEESDKFVGSFFSKDDVKTILGVNDEDLSVVPFEDRNGIQCIAETILRKDYWEKGLIPNAVPAKVGKASVSFDEYVLMAIIRHTYPSAIITPQYKWGRKRIDMFVEIGDKKFFLEFHGPGHFKNVSGFKDPVDPFIRKAQIENEFGIPCYIWPYWIQRCSSNLRLLLGDAKPEERGYGALWSTKVFFGDFLFANSAQIIEDLTKPFKAAPDGDYGYFYEGWDEGSYGRIKEEHPIIKRIMSGRVAIERLIPKGIDPGTKNKWLPKCLRKM